MAVDDGEDEVLTAEEAAALLRVSLQTVLKESRLGQLPGIKIGREWRYSRQALLHHLRQYAGNRDEADLTGEEPREPESAAE